MNTTFKVLLITGFCAVLAGCSSGQATQGSTSPVGLKSGCNQSGPVIAFVRGGGDQFYYCSSP